MGIRNTACSSAPDPLLYIWYDEVHSTCNVYCTTINFHYSKRTSSHRQSYFLLLCTSQRAWILWQEEEDCDVTQEESLHCISPPLQHGKANCSSCSSCSKLANKAFPIQLLKCMSFIFNKFNSKNTIDMNTISPRLSTEECGVYPLNKVAKYVKSPVIVNCAINGVRMSPCHISENLVTARHITHEISYAASRRTSSTIPIEIRPQT